MQRVAERTAEKVSCPCWNLSVGYYFRWDSRFRANLALAGRYVVILASVNPPPAFVARVSPTSEEANKALLRRAFEAWNEQDRDAFAACHADDVVLHGADETVEGLDDVLAVQWGFFDAFPDTVLTLSDSIAERDLVALRYTATGTHDGAFENIEPTGNTFEMSLMAMVRVAGGAITEKWVRMDALGLLEQLDALDSPVV